jgi:hypothetical protein
MTEPATPDPPGEPLLAASQVEDVFVATEEVRATDFPDVPAELLASVLAAERDNPEDRTAAQRAVGRVIDAYLAKSVPGQNGKDST